MRVAVMGAGALGRRHLESLARSAIEMELTVVDPSQAARDAAASHIADIPGDQIRKIAYLESPSLVRHPVDLAILSTNARERLETLRVALALGARGLILEKVLFDRLRDYDIADQLLAEHGAQAWVNCARRANPRASELRGWLKGPIHYEVQGTGWGLGCNVVHHLDELSFLTGQAISAIDVAGLDPGSIAAKRQGYRELTGTLRAQTLRGDTFEATCNDGVAGDRVVTIRNADRTFSISQTAQQIQIEDADGSRHEPYPLALQSEATARHVADIVNRRPPALPEWDDAARTHRVMIAAFLDHLRKTTVMQDADECPIT